MDHKHFHHSQALSAGKYEIPTTLNWYQPIYNWHYEYRIVFLRFLDPLYQFVSAQSKLLTYMLC